MSSARRSSSALTVAGSAVLVLMIGLSVRSPITSVSALLDEIAQNYTLGTTELASLSAIPVLLFGLASPLAPWLARRLGSERSAALLLGVLGFGTLLRPLNSITLIVGTVMVGFSIALLGILTPQLIRRHLSGRPGLWTGVYTSSFGVSAALGAALAVPLLGLLGGDVALALAVWGIPIAGAAIFAMIAAPRLRAATHREVGPASVGGAWSILRAPRVWSVTGFFGCQALIYFSLTAWLPTIAVDRGLGATEAGLLLAWLSLAGLPAALLAPVIAARSSSQTTIITIVSVLSGLGLAGLAFGPIQLAVVFVAILGVAQSAAFGLAVTLIVLKAPSAARTADFSAMAQGIGYAFAALGPLGFGLLAQRGVSWSAILAGLLAVVVAQLVFGVRAGRRLPLGDEARMSGADSRQLTR